MARRKKKYKSIAISLVLIVGIILSMQFRVFERIAPIIYIEDTIYVNFQEPLALRISDEGLGLSYAKITLKKDEKDSGIVLYDERAKGKKELVLQINLPKTIKNTESYTLKIEAKDKSLWNFFMGNKTTKNVLVIADTRKPAVNILSSSYQIEQGGAAAVVFEASDENLQDVYVENDKGLKFKVLPYLKENYYATLLAWDAKEKNFIAYVVAKDKAGNVTKERIRYYIKNRTYRNSNIALKDNFLDGKIEDLTNQYAPDERFNRLEKFKFVNETLRLGNEDKIHKVSSNVSSKNFDDFKIARFAPLKNAMKVADFADHRFYFYNETFVSDSYHMGLDLASIAKDDIYSSLDGKVVFAEENGIYGINIIIDHGFGLYSLYGHCTSKLVAEGDEVKAGDIIAKTGISGLALGDHLHFGILIQGIEVRPEQFQDETWLKSNIISVLEESKQIILRQR